MASHDQSYKAGETKAHAQVLLSLFFFFFFYQYISHKAKGSNDDFQG